MSAYTRLASSVLFPLHERLKRHDSVAVRRRLERSQWLPRAAIEAEQLQRLRLFLLDIGTNVPFYKALFARVNFAPEALNSLDDLSRLPLLTKSDIRTAGATLLASDHGPVSRYNTGGSSGEPLIFYIGKQRKSHDVASKWRATRWWGVDIGDREAVVWGSPIELGSQDRIKHLRDAVFRTWLLPAFEMNEARLDGFLDNIRQRRPAMLFGYPSALSLMAGHAIKRGLAMNGLGIKVVFVTSERLYDHQRELIERVFGCPVANGYGGRDAGFIAHQCPAGSMHVTAEDIVVELVDGQGRQVNPGEVGEVVITHLASRDFPFVRYRTGDMAVAEDSPCACGRGLPRLKEIQGRSTDFVVAADGTVMHGLALIYVIRDLPGVSRFRIVQHTLQRTQVQLEAEPGQDISQHFEAIQTAFKQRLGPNVVVDVGVVERLDSEKSGKFRFVISHVDATRSTAGATT